MEQHELEITISRTGEVRMHVQGVKGKSCLSYAKFLAELVGRVKEQQLTSEYYEPDSKVAIRLEQRRKP